MTYDRYQIELGVLQNSTIKSKQYKFMDMDTPYPYLRSSSCNRRRLPPCGLLL